MDKGRVIVSVQNQMYEVTNAQAAFGEDFPADLREILIQGTADDIATLMMLEEMSPIIVSSGTSIQVRVADRKRGLTALGVSDVEAAVNQAIERLKAEDHSAWAKRALPFMI